MIKCTSVTVIINTVKDTEYVNMVISLLLPNIGCESFDVYYAEIQI